jgi:hypothetical protein
LRLSCNGNKGKRYNRETLEVQFKQKSIADVLDMTVEEGIELIQAVPAIRKVLETLGRVGLDYIQNLPARPSAEPILVSALSRRRPVEPLDREANSHASVVLLLARQRSHALADDVQHHLVRATADRCQARVAVHA